MSDFINWYLKEILILNTEALTLIRWMRKLHIEFELNYFVEVTLQSYYQKNVLTYYQYSIPK